MKKYLILITLMCANVLVFAKNETSNPESGYHISLEVPQLKNNPLYLGKYVDKNMYTQDTLLLDAKGKGVFAAKTPLQEGLYFIYNKKDSAVTKLIDFLVGDDQTFNIKLDTASLVYGTTISGSEQSEAFSHYVKFISSKREEADKIAKRYEKVDENSKEFLQRQEEINVVNEQVAAYQDSVIHANGTKMVGILIKALTDITVPEMEAANDTIKRQQQYYYYRNHYFDNVDLSDQRLIFTPMRAQKIDYYIQKMLSPIPDTAAMQVVDLIEKSKGDTLTYRVTLTAMLNHAVSQYSGPAMMGMDKLLLTIGQKYYLSGEAPWADSALMTQLDREVRKIRYNQIGDKGQNLKVETIDGKVVDLYGLPEDYVLVFFYEPGCGHCKKETPILHNTLYQKFKDKGFQVMAFYIGNKKEEEWQKFVDEHQLYDWLNVWDPTGTSYYWYYYDTSTTPGVYLLNKDRKIIAKKVDIETLDMILEKEMEKEKEQ